MAVFTGTEMDDRLEGTSDADEFHGLGGDDTIVGAAGLDTAYGGEGDDVLFVIPIAFGEGGNDIIAGGSDLDAMIDGGVGNDTIYGTSHAAGVLFGGDGNDFIDGGPGPDRIEGGSGNDMLHGGLTGPGDDNRDTILGGTGDDFISGGGEGDMLDGGTGSDLIVAINTSETEPSGSDTLSGGVDLDFDRLVSEADGVADTFIMNSPGAQAIGIYDQIEGFESGIDKIDLTMTGATGALDLAFSDYAGIGMKVIGPDGSAVLVVGHQIADVTVDWFIFG